MGAPRRCVRDPKRWGRSLWFLGAVAAVPAAGEAVGMTETMRQFVMQLAVILVVARLAGQLLHRYVRLPAVLGEVGAGILLGPHALGGLSVAGLGPLFPPPPEGAMPIRPELYGVATLGSMVLLFISGLETDVGMFLRFARVGTLVGIGGVVVSFAVGGGAALWFGMADSWLHPAALFLGAIATATSVGITARILSEKKKVDSPEGVTILAGAVLDDMLGIVVLAIISVLAAGGGHFSAGAWGSSARVVGKAVGAWLAFSVVGWLLARRLADVLKKAGSYEAMAAFGFGLALLLGGIMESAGLAMIIGAYVMGISLSRTDVVHAIEQPLRGAYQVLVPAFFCMMGMLVDLSLLGAMWWQGLVFALLAIAAKVIGCAVPAWATQFNWRGALRIGIGMVPRGEVALVIAGVGLASGAIDRSVFSMAVMMTMITTLAAPPFLARSFAGPDGLKTRFHLPPPVRFEIDLKSYEAAEFLVSRVGRALRQEGFLVYMLQQDPLQFQARKGDIVISGEESGTALILTGAAEHLTIGRLVLLEELLALKALSEHVPGLIEGRVVDNHVARDLFRAPGPPPASGA